MGTMTRVVQDREQQKTRLFFKKAHTLTSVQTMKQACVRAAMLLPMKVSTYFPGGNTNRRSHKTHPAAVHIKCSSTRKRVCCYLNPLESGGPSGYLPRLRHASHRAGKVRGERLLTTWPTCPADRDKRGKLRVNPDSWDSLEWGHS